MNDPRDESLTLEQLEAIESLCEGYVARLQAGESSCMDALLIEADEPLRPRLLHDLMTLELARRVDAGDDPKLDEYLKRFPDHALIVEAVFKYTYPTVPYLTEPIESKGSLEHEEELPRRFGQYELTEVLGAGGMGIVYRAKQFLDNNHIRDVALKLVRPDRLSAVLPQHRDDLMKRFRDEIQHVARLEHDHIVRVYDVGEVDGRPYFSMELSRGSDLAKRLRKGPVKGREAAKILLPIARALHFAHERQVLHRDVKPSNILLSESGNPCISDFGLSKVIDEAAPELSVTGGAIEGAPPYMSPEQAKGKSLSPASDVYSLGATLYECLTGRPPFRAPDIARTLRQVIELDPVPPRSFNRDIERDIETICLKCLEKQPGQRYRTAKELAEELRRYAVGEPIAARPISVVRRILRWSRQQPGLAVTWLAVTIFYAYHLACVYLLKDFNFDAQSERLFNLVATFVAVVWVIGAYRFQKLLVRTRGSRWPLFGWVTMEVALLTLLLSHGRAANSALVLVYFVLVAASVLRFQPVLVAYVTLLCVAAYLFQVWQVILNGTSGGSVDVSVRFCVPFVLSLLCIGLIQYFALRRSRAAIDLISERNRNSSSALDSWQTWIY